MKLSNLKNENKNNNASFDHMKINKANNLINNIQFNKNISQIKLEENEICNNFYFMNIFKIWNSNVTKLFSGILSSNSDIESNILQTLIYLYILTFFFEKKFNESSSLLVDLSIISIKFKFKVI